MKTFRSLLFCASALLATPAISLAQSAAPDARWTPFLGCWTVVEESVEDGAHLLPTAGTTTSSPARVCVAPADGGVTISTLVNDQPVLTETVVADAGERPVNEPGCRGSQRAEWSALGPRVFARAEITCGDAPARQVFGLSALAAGPLWLDVQMIESQGRKSLRVRRYRKVSTPPNAVSPARELATAPLGKQLTLAEIAEAGQKVPTEVLQAAVLDLGRGGYDLKARDVRGLHAAGVPEPVIDLMVAMSYPKRFVVERAGGGGGGGFGNMWDPTVDMWPYMAMWPHGGLWPYHADALWVSRMYSPFYSTYYSPFGYRYWGYFDPDYFRYHYDPAFVVLTPGGTARGDGATMQPTGEGRVVDGRGYTRIRRTEPATPTRVNGSDGGWGTASAGSGSGASGGVTNGGYSNGGASGGGERVAVPRPPGS